MCLTRPWCSASATLLVRRRRASKIWWKFEEVSAGIYDIHANVAIMSCAISSLRGTRCAVAWCGLILGLVPAGRPPIRDSWTFEGGGGRCSGRLVTLSPSHRPYKGRLKLLAPVWCGIRVPFVKLGGCLVARTSLCRTTTSTYSVWKLL